MTTSHQGSDHVMPDFECVRCHTVMDMAWNPVGGEGPSPGDITLCAYCGEAYTIQLDLSPRPLTDEEFKQSDEESDGQLTKMRLAIVAATVALARMTQGGC